MRCIACVSVLHIIAIGSTLFRLFYRHRTRRLWWDDYTAIIPLVMECMYLTVLWLRVFERGLSLSIRLNYRNSLTLFFRPWALRFKGKDRASLVIHGLFYHRHMVCLFALLVTQIHQKPYSRWTRISLGLAIARIIPRWEPVRKFTMGVVCAFGGTYVICLSLSVSHCVKDKTWHRPGIPIVSCGSKPLGIMGTCSTSFPFVSQRLFANLIFACFSGYYI
jgi:hypothetical protein